MPCHATRSLLSQQFENRIGDLDRREKSTASYPEPAVLRVQSVRRVRRDDYLFELSCSLLSTSSSEKLPGFCRGGKSLYVAR